MFSNLFAKNILSDFKQPTYDWKGPSVMYKERWTAWLENFVINDIPLLRRGGRLQPMLKIMIAHLIASFNWLESWFGPDHVLVQKILGKWKKLKIQRSRRPDGKRGSREHEVLHAWSELIQNDYDNDMSCRLLCKSTGADQTLDILCGEVRQVVNNQQMVYQRMCEL